MTTALQNIPVQPVYLNGEPPLRAANISSVTLRSPFRFPGGKTWLIPHIRQWLSFRSPLVSEFCEPFAGGAIVALTVAAEALAGKVLMSEADPKIAAVWRAILDGHGSWLANKISKFRLTRRSLHCALASHAQSVNQVAFQTILRNRTFRGGILAESSRPLKRGENGNGIKSRWYPQTLKARILAIAELRDRISFIEGDGLELIKKHSGRNDVAFFLDPPYVAGEKKAGSRLYNKFDVNHEELFRIVNTISGDFLMTYEDSPEIRNLAMRYGFQMRLVTMRNAHHVRMNELLISRDLTWIRDTQQPTKSL